MQFYRGIIYCHHSRGYGIIIINMVMDTGGLRFHLATCICVRNLQYLRFLDITDGFWVLLLTVSGYIHVPFEYHIPGKNLISLFLKET